jgi:hypothetical protein
MSWRALVVAVVVVGGLGVAWAAPRERTVRVQKGKGGAGLRLVHTQPEDSPGHYLLSSLDAIAVGDAFDLVGHGGYLGQVRVHRVLVDRSCGGTVVYRASALGRPDAGVWALQSRRPLDRARLVRLEGARRDLPPGTDGLSYDVAIDLDEDGAIDVVKANGDCRLLGRREGYCAVQLERHGNAWRQTELVAFPSCD